MILEEFFNLINSTILRSSYAPGPFRQKENWSFILFFYLSHTSSIAVAAKDSYMLEKQYSYPNTPIFFSI